MILHGHCKLTLIEFRLEELSARIHNSLMNNPIYNPTMPEYEQISPRYIPQTTSTTIKTEISMQPDLSYHQASHLSSENCDADLPMYAPETNIQTVKNTEYNDPIDKSVEGTSTTATSVYSYFHGTLTLNGKGDSIESPSDPSDDKESTKDAAWGLTASRQLT